MFINRGEAYGPSPINYYFCINRKMLKFTWQKLKILKFGEEGELYLSI